VSDTSPASRYQIEDQNDQGNDEQDMNQAAANVEAEPQQPENQEHYENSPEHFLFSLTKCCGHWRQDAPSTPVKHQIN
jgi:hypothetical protein